MKTLRRMGICVAIVGVLALASVAFRTMKGRGIEAKLALLRQRGHPTTMAELNAWYLAVPAESNAALGVLAAMEIFPSDAPAKIPILGTSATKVEGFAPWIDEARLLARTYVSSNATAYAALKKALRLPVSRYPVTLSSSAAIIPHLTQVKVAAQNLTLAAQLAAEEGNREEATAAVVNVFQVARTLEPEPILISFMVRNACVAIGVSSTERIVNRLDLTDEQLARIQVEINSTLGTNTLTRVLAGETAFGLDGFAMSPTQIAAMMNPAGAGILTMSQGTIGYTLYTWSGLKGADHESYLDAMIKMQDAANEEFPQRLTTVSNIAYDVSGGSNSWPFVKPMTRMLMPTLAKTVERDARITASLRCALAALAVERFRLAHDGKLPATLAELVPKFLADVPADPYDGKPLRFRPLKKGFVVYSLGEDGVDDGGRPSKGGSKTPTGYDVTFSIER